MMELPKIEIPALHNGRAPQHIEMPTGNLACVLIVDDNPAKLTSLASVVSGMALEVVTATSGREALRQLLKLDFALILLDVYMPTMDGYETAQIIHSRPRSAHTPIIFITAEAVTDEDRFKGYAVGGADWILSPIMPEILKAKIKVFVDLFYLNRVVQHQTEELKKLNNELEQRVIERTAKLALFARIFDSVTEGITVTGADRSILYVNPAFTAITGYAAEEVTGTHVLTPRFMDEASYSDIWHNIKEAGHWQGEMIDQRKDGKNYTEWLSISTMKNACGEISHYIAVFSDISERKAVEEQVAFMAQHDFLTGLPNRLLLQDRLTQAIAHAERKQGKLAVIFLDLDHFKTINDSLGHPVGDKLLQEVADRIKGAVRTSDTVSRPGGDEFIIMLQEPETTDAIAMVAVKLLTGIASPYLIDGSEIQVTTSIGISVFPEDGRDSDSLIKHADNAMYQAKGSGRNNYQFFTQEMNRRTLERISLRTKLSHALECRELSLHYQPQVDLQSGRIIGAEALLRWNQSMLGMVSPAQFIPIAEENGMIIPIGEWVLREACRQNQEWRKLGLPEITMAANLSAVQFRQKNFGKMIMVIVHESGLAPSAFELEITESVVMHDAGAAIALLQQLKTFGLKLSVDDFGTGYSSLSYLKKFPIDKLKIDQSFVRNMMIDPDDAVIASTIISMAQSLRLKVIAEGVETPEQLAFLKQQGCDEMQGYYFSKPLTAEKFACLLSGSTK
ncbi:EAL domain-containing protein [Nitrosospira sp. Nsp13]|uniref:two-component system response regulator n=1 Tax=Nitrosospira sp. Nsp13 TaxID=1855332 RepID=UPI000885B0FF|nr:EAL domain-containing protein [Nitrosospira sp. Nsp13]SCX76234.1 PAS domain S-box-containing protein/diguanylate cyclase (GGDEF) domain-containing protein [Nitrosospira sp. Nsp13]